MENQYISFKLFNQYCVLPIEDVVEVLPMQGLVRTKAHELNVMMWRNHAIPVIDPVAMLSKVNKEQELSVKSKVLVIKMSEDMREVGIVVDVVMGVEEIQPGEIEEATINDARYIVGRVSRKTHQLKILDFNEFMKGNVVEKFPIIYAMKTDELKTGVGVASPVSEGKEEVVETMRLKSINWLIRANKRHIEESFILDMKKIYDLTFQLYKI